jgi:hypothetical protein
MYKKTGKVRPPGLRAEPAPEPPRRCSSGGGSPRCSKPRTDWPLSVASIDVRGVRIGVLALLCGGWRTRATQHAAHIVCDGIKEIRRDPLG